jgi:hypothetical protein
MLLMKIITTYYSISYIGLIYGKKDKILFVKDAVTTLQKERTNFELI